MAKKKVSRHEAWLLKALRNKAIKRQNNLCHWCKLEMEAPGNTQMSASAEHLIPTHAGGQTIPSNIVAAHRKCNQERHPELNHSGGGIYASTEDNKSSPFAILKKLLHGGTDA